MVKIFLSIQLLFSQYTLAQNRAQIQEEKTQAGVLNDKLNQEITPMSVIENVNNWESLAEIMVMMAGEQDTKAVFQDLKKNGIKFNAEATSSDQQEFPFEFKNGEILINHKPVEINTQNNETNANNIKLIKYRGYVFHYDAKKSFYENYLSFSKRLSGKDTLSLKSNLFLEQAYAEDTIDPGSSIKKWWRANHLAALGLTVLGLYFGLDGKFKSAFFCFLAAIGIAKLVVHFENHDLDLPKLDEITDFKCLRNGFTLNSKSGSTFTFARDDSDPFYKSSDNPNKVAPIKVESVIDGAHVIRPADKVQKKLYYYGIDYCGPDNSGKYPGESIIKDFLKQHRGVTNKFHSIDGTK